IVAAQAGERVATLLEAGALHQPERLKARCTRIGSGVRDVLGPSMTLAAQLIDARCGPTTHLFDPQVGNVAGACRRDVRASRAVACLAADAKDPRVGHERAGGRLRSMTTHTPAGHRALVGSAEPVIPELFLPRRRIPLTPVREVAHASLTEGISADGGIGHA